MFIRILSFFSFTIGSTPLDTHQVREWQPSSEDYLGRYMVCVPAIHIVSFDAESFENINFSAISNQQLTRYLTNLVIVAIFPEMWIPYG